MSHVGRLVVAMMVHFVTMVISLMIAMINLVVLSVMVTMITMVNFVGRDVQRLILLILLMEYAVMDLIRLRVAVSMIKLSLIRV